MGFIISGAVGGDVNADGNGNLQTTLPTTPAQAGYAATASRMDEGAVTGSPLVRHSITSVDGRLATGIDTPMFDFVFNATAQNVGVWKYVFASALTCTMGSGSLLMNSASTLTASAGCQLSTFRQFPLVGTGSLGIELIGSFTGAPLANQIVEFGQFTHNTGIVAPLDGAYFRFTSGGLFGYVNYNGVEVPTGTSISAATIGIDVAHSYRISVNQRQTDFWVDDELLGSIATPAANGVPFATVALPVSMQFRNSALVSGSPVMQAKFNSVSVYQRDTPLLSPRATQLAGMGAVAAQGQSGGTLTSTALYTNSLAAGAGVAPTNTTAALGSGLGGQFSALPTLAVPTDGIISSYQNPAGSVTQTPRILYITGVRVQGAVTTALTGGPVIYAYSLAYGHTAVSMATVDTASFATATTKAPRRIPLGFETYAAAAAVGVLGSAGIFMPFASPIPVNPGEFIAICAKNMGTVTTLGVITVLVSFNGYWE